MSSERTLNVDIGERAQIEAHLRLAADTLARRLRRSGRLAGGVRLKLKRSDFGVLTRQSTLREPSDTAAVLLGKALELLAEVTEPGPFRLVGLGVYDLTSAAAVRAQLELVPVAGARARRLETAIDALVDRFGAGVVQRAGDLTRDRGVGVAANLDFLVTDED
jgi:DNA polymerase-4